MIVLEKAPAKINLSLDVLHKRPDGYHEVEMVMTTVDLADRIELKLLPGSQIKIESESRFVPNDERNLAYRAAQLMQNHFNIKQGVRIFLEKNIPVAAGLAGGSSDAAAVLRGLNKLWKINASIDTLAELGARIGSDVSFCVYGGTAVARGRGEIIEELPPPPACWVVLAKPAIGVSTQTIYQKLNIKKAEHPNTKAMIDALYRGSFDDICANVSNILEGVTTKLHPEVNQIKEKMKQAGAEAVLMSGSGPTVFALVSQDGKLHRIYNSLKGFCPEVYMVRMLGMKETT
ncbi:4-(cytidine 5'-diphospho)-2-C-methyl-D-erythritol kinase [Halobacillus massiliensis]|uniref:4-(cytidine 5'-diphospho)-2-C-methyl-D-erythritol kinase n=1 Tax=Halobacillus massiliensis TaxID=1926286 RepID=UPI0009E5F418|nr:4-(cytidine 5'-diphospho)-2-C-methyl-D-erythritol kinase [Halobacillus massiliensis]